jgi:hypothetical protein
MTRTIYESWNPITQRSTDVELDSETGLPVITHSQNTKPIVESAKRLASAFDPHAKRPNDMVHVARIPLVIWNRLQMLGITKDEKALNAWLDSRECRLFRCDDGRKL